MKPESIKTKIFLDGGDPKETKEIVEKLGFLDGQTTNPTLIARNPEAKARLETGNKFEKEEVYDFYHKVVGEISELLPNGSVSIEVYGDLNTTAEEMVTQGREMNTWIPNAHVKLPTIPAGLEAAKVLTQEGVRVNMTLIFTQEQAAAVYVATKGAKKGDVFLSPFEGRLHDTGKDGIDLITNITKMYENGDSHVEILMASVRDMNHFYYTLYKGVDIVTVPASILVEWSEAGMPVPGVDIPVDDFTHENIHESDIEHIEYKDIDLDKEWQDYNITHELTDKGLARFAEDWNNLLV